MHARERVGLWRLQGRINSHAKTVILKKNLWHYFDFEMTDIEQNRSFAKTVPQRIRAPFIGSAFSTGG